MNSLNNVVKICSDEINAELHYKRPSRFKKSLLFMTVSFFSLVLVGCKSHIHEAKVDKALIKTISHAESYAHQFALKKMMTFQYHQCYFYPKAGCKLYITKMAEYLSKNGYAHTTYHDLNNEAFVSKVTPKLGEYDSMRLPILPGGKIRP